MGDKAEEEQIYGHLGNAYQGLGQFETAIEYHQRHLEIAKEMGDNAGEESVMAVSATLIKVWECSNSHQMPSAFSGNC